MSNNPLEAVTQAVNSLLTALKLPDESAKANEVLGEMSFPQFSRLLPYRDYNQESGLFMNDTTMGFMLEAIPINGANESIVEVLDHMLRTKLPRGVPFCIHLMSSQLVGDRIEYGLREFSWSGEQAERFNAIIRIGDLPIIRDSEIQNFCLHGTVGAGKSEVIRRLANYARQRGDMVVIYDRSGEFVKSYYDPSIDKILNPLDARCAAWDLWKECLTQPDFDNTANTLIPMGTKEDPFWQGSGRTIFAEAAYLMRNDPNRSYSKLVDTLLSIKIEKLRTFLRNSPAANLVEEKIEKTAISIRAVLTNYVKAIRYLQGIEHNGEPFTIRDWMRGVREDQKNGWLFISSNADTHASLKPVTGCASRRVTGSAAMWPTASGR